MKHLVIAEKPSVARDIARVLGCSKKNNSYIEGKDYVVTWALGHLVTLADPEEYGEQYKTWRLDTLPMLPGRWKLVVIKQTSRQYHAVKEQIFRKDISDIIIATDAGREGELVARWILEKAGNRKPLKRLWISSVTDKAIREGFSHLRPGKDYENLYHAAVARAEADWEVGINATRALTCKYNAQLSCGRVQTPTLAMIAAREEEIKKFIPKPYYGLKAVVNGIPFTWADAKTNSGRTFDKSRIEAIYKNAESKIQITEVKKKAKKTIEKPKVIIPVFPGQNCEYDTMQQFERAGAEVEIYVFNNLNVESIERSLKELSEKIASAQILMVVGGFSSGDEPDGSGKYIANVLSNPQINQAVQTLLANDGLILGICNGFQALIKSGLLPYGDVTKLSEDSPTLFRNNINRHVSHMATTKITSNKSPWLSSFTPGQTHTIAVSHGEGKFVVSEEVAKELFENGQVATQYVDFDGNPTMNGEFNINGSYYAIEGITSKDGRIFGKMGHSERYEDGLFKNIEGDKLQNIFENGVNYFRNKD